uniref:Calmodulin n=1 Tax=Elaeophora elaphi TaxID=1147741 RepID=A0A0R3RN15_9BILA
MDATMFSKLRRRIRAMSIRLARLIMKNADTNEDGHIDKREAQKIAFEQEGISADDVNEMVMSVDDNNDGELNAPEFADFERIIRSRAIDTSKKALKVVDRDGGGTVTMDEAKFIAFDHYGFDEKILGIFFAQADENEDGQLD